MNQIKQIKETIEIIDTLINDGNNNFKNRVNNWDIG